MFFIKILYVLGREYVGIDFKVVSLVLVLIKMLKWIIWLFYSGEGGDSIILNDLFCFFRGIFCW